MYYTARICMDSRSPRRRPARPRGQHGHQPQGPDALRDVIRDRLRRGQAQRQRALLEPPVGALDGQRPHAVAYRQGK